MGNMIWYVQGAGELQPIERNLKFLKVRYEKQNYISWGN